MADGEKRQRTLVVVSECRAVPWRLSSEFEFRVGSTCLLWLATAPLFLEDVSHFQAQITCVGGVGEARIGINSAFANEPFNFSVEVLHAVGRAIPHCVEKALAFRLAFFDVFACAHRGFEDFDDGDAALAVEAGKQALRKNVAKGLRKASTDTLLIFHREATDDALDGLRCVDRVESRENQVAGFRGFESDLNRFAVAHLPDQNHLRGLAKSATKS